MVFLVILSRWLHVITACVAVGGVFFARIVMPGGLALLDPEPRQMVFLKIRRTFKMVVHSAILLLLITGTYNTMLAWSKYNLDPKHLHMLWGIHLLLAFIVFSISLYVLAGKKPPATHWKWMAINLVVMALTIAASSTLKWAREKTVAAHPATIARL
jgi:uncharacterized membrane protein